MVHALVTPRLDDCNCGGGGVHLKKKIGHSSTECYSQGLDWHEMNDLYHSSFGPSTLAVNLFLGSIQSAGVDF